MLRDLTDHFHRCVHYPRGYTCTADLGTCHHCGIGIFGIQCGFQDPINIAINYFFCIAFFACLIILYLYRNKEMKLQFQKDTVNGCVLTKELITYMKQYGIADMLYYTVCTIVIMLLIDGGMESGIFFAVENSIIRTILCVFLFIVVYTISVSIILKIWDKQRPEYLKKGYTERNNV